MDVGDWLRSLDLGQYEAAFRDNAIDVDLLPSLAAEDLKDLGVAIVGHRRRLLDAIAALGTASKPTPPPAAASTPATLPAPAVSSRPEARSGTDAERRPITVMFCDLVGSTALASRLDAEDWRSLVNAYLDEASAAVTRFGGHVLKRLGDGLMALFGYPTAQENDAERAVRAALAIQRALSEINARNASKGAPELSARIGLESGPVVVETAGEVFGDAPNVAARVQAAADPGSVLVTRNVQLQVAGLFVTEERGPRKLKGLPEPVQLFRIIRASGAGRRGGARSLTPFVGRDEELGLLARRWESVRLGEGQLVLVVGEPGLGKSRLIEEFHARLVETPHTWVEWSASQLLQNTPLHPIAQWGRLRFGMDAPTEQRLADLEGTLRLVGLDPIEHAPLLAPLLDIPLPPGREAAFAREELRRRQLAALITWVLAGARSQPVVLAFEDLQWADPTSLDLLRTLAERGGQAPLFLVATSRPEFRPSWGMRSHHSAISLAPLKRAQVYQMVGELASRHALSDELVEGLGERTGGVPLFIEEVTRLLLERGVVGGVQAIPPTLQQSLAARLDRLGPAREVAQIGAVLGRDFAYPLLRGVAELDEPALQASLERLAEADLLFVEGAPPQSTYRFKHALIQDAAYESQLKSRRQALHRRAAEIQRDDPERATSKPEIIAHHFTQAGLDDLAIEWWGKAGDQALRRSAFQEAIAHLGKAIEMADKAGAAAATAPSQRVKLQTDYAQAVMWSKGFASRDATAALESADKPTAWAASADDRTKVYLARFLRSFIRGELRAANETAKDLVRQGEVECDVAATTLGRRHLGMIYLFSGELVQAKRQLDLALGASDVDRAANELPSSVLNARAAVSVYLALTIWHLGGPDQARELMREAITLADLSGHAITIINVRCLEAFLECYRSDPVATLRVANITRELGRQHGMAYYISAAEVLANWATARLHSHSDAANALRTAMERYFEEGNGIGAPLYHGLLAELAFAAGDGDSALELIDKALGIATQTGERLGASYFNRLRGDILLKQDHPEPAHAEEAYQTAIAVAKEQGARSYELLGALSLAKLYQSTGRPADAHAVLALALEGFAPTPQMPEIAEAQVLLERLA